MKDQQKPTEIYSIFGQIEAAVADVMEREKKCTKIHKHMIPRGELYDSQQREAMFAIVVPGRYVREFVERVDRLRQ